MKVRKDYIYLSIVTLTTGFLISHSIELTKLRALEREGDRQWQQETKLNEQIVKEKEQNRILEVQLLALQRQVAKVEEEVAEHQSEAAAVLAELEAARMMAGVIPVEGPGVVVTLQDNPNASQTGDVMKNIVHEQDVTLVVNELRAAGAEAISINGQRLVSNSAIRCVGPTIIVNGVKSATPFVITAIGDSATLSQGLQLPGGVVDRLKDFVQISVEQKDLLQVPAFVGDISFDQISS
ncbi:DUF881 domain-containing protein [Brevibacillus humidisoli]|uniref:DUF881 domain-containing protein n=1 Tax=Brevibacillus humidisoli TaxID=2895522 RepID=UPI001E51D915|nr:DUF881 domain-containing protein [Brevibacillus humidisoli]UFJ41928.1 DUF881 domain-containing protein [Brevibacillus humidisoli]